MSTRIRMAPLSALALAATAAMPATASDYPEQEIELIIPYGPGGATDVIFRLIAEEAEQYLGQSIVPVNMAGAGATRGSRHVLEADPDGYTLLGSHDTIALSNLAGMVDYSYMDFDPIALLTQTINIPSTYPDHPIQSADDIADYVEENPGEVRFSMIPTSTDHFFWAQFFEAADIDMDDIGFVSYDDTGSQVSALMAGDIDFAMLNLPSGGSYFEDESLVPLAVAHPERLDALPDTPTLREVGIDLDNATSRGLFAPPGTPDDVIETVADAFGRALESEELQKRIDEEFGTIVNFLDGQEYIDFLEENEENLSKAAEGIDFDS